jgi:aryl-alcohol dehydrogenase-like predicted oxidoreductase
MALAFVRQQPFVASTLLGATTLEQLQINIDSYNLTLTEDVLQELEAIHRRYTFPSP